MSTKRDDPTMVVVVFADWRKAEHLAEDLASQGFSQAHTVASSWEDYAAADCADLTDTHFCPTCQGAGDIPAAGFCGTCEGTGLR